MSKGEAWVLRENSRERLIGYAGINRLRQLGDFRRGGKRHSARVVVVG